LDPFPMKNPGWGKLLILAHLCITVSAYENNADTG
jgi:hypothetical protein